MGVIPDLAAPVDHVFGKLLRAGKVIPAARGTSLSLEDNLFRIFGGDRIQGMMKAFRVEDLPIESKMLTASLDEAQRKVSPPCILSLIYLLIKWIEALTRVLTCCHDVSSSAIHDGDHIICAAC